MRKFSYKWLFGTFVCAAALCCVSAVSADGEKTGEEKTAEKKADDKKAVAKKIVVQHLVTNLESPSGVAVQPKTGHVFISSRYGIYRFVPKTKKLYLEIDSYPDSTYGKGDIKSYTKFNIGPLGLTFMDDTHLVVGDGSRPDGAELVRVYKIDAKPKVRPDGLNEVKAAAYTIGPIKAKEGVSIKGEGNFYGVAVGGGAIFVTCNGDDTKGWIAKATIKDGKPGKELVPTIATKTATGVDAPAPIIFWNDGKELLVGQMGEMNKAGDSLLTTYDVKTGKLLKKYKTGLSDIVGLAYSPKTKKLYATDFGWLDASKKEAKEKVGGLYELIIKDGKVEAKKIVALDKPAGMSFDADGKLYITQFGTKDPKAPKDRSHGGLYIIDAGL